MAKKEVPIEGIFMMWTLTIFLGMIWYYVPAWFGEGVQNLLLILALFSSVISFRVSIKRK